MSALVAGYCPSCGGATLFLGSGGYVTCSRSDCANPTAAADILDDRETEHLVTFTDHDFTIRHPLRERLNGELEDCELHHHVSTLGGPPVQPGRYRATRTIGSGAWFWDRVPNAQVTR